jgi:WD40 repeat protein
MLFRTTFVVLLFAAPALAQEPPLPAGAVARIGSTRLRHAAEVCALAYSADGKLLASAAEDGTVLVHDATAGTLRHRFQIAPRTEVARRVLPGGGIVTELEAAEAGPFAAVLRFSPDSQRLYIAGRGAIYAYRLDDGKPAFHALRVSEQCLALSPQLAAAFVGSMAFSVRDIDSAAGQFRRRLDIGGTFPSRAEFTPHGLLSSGRFVVRLFDPVSGAQRGEWSWPADGEMSAVTLSPDGNTFALIVATDPPKLGSESPAPKPGELVLWDRRDLKQRRTVAGVTYAECLSYAPDGKSLAVCCREGLLLLDPNSGRVLRTMAGCPRVTRLAFSPDGKTLAAASGMAISLWDTTTGRRLAPSAEPAGDVVCVRFVDSHRLLVFAGEIVEYDWRAGTVAKRYPAPPHTNPAADEVSRDSSTLVVGDELSVRAIDVATGRVKWVLNGVAVERCGFSPDGTRLTVLGPGGFATLDPRSGPGPFRVYTKEFDLTRAVGGLTLSPDGALVAGSITTPSDDDQPDIKVVSLWRSRDGKAVRDLSPNVHSWGRPAFSHDGRRLATLAFVNVPGGTDVDERAQYRLLVWETQYGRLLRDVRELRGDASCLALAPDGYSAAYSSGDGSVRVLETSTGVERAHFIGNQRDIRSIAFSPCGRYLASASVDGPVLVWDLYAPLLGPAPAPAKLWAELARDEVAFLAMRRLAAAPEAAVELFREQIRPVKPIAEERVRQLLADLDSPRYAVRATAVAELQRFADQLEPHLNRHAAAPGTSAEVRRQLRRLVERVDEPTGDFVVRLRALEVLQQINSPAAKALLAEWADDAPAARFAQEARAALERMKR